LRFAERSGAVTILPDFRSKLVISYAIRRPKRGDDDLARFSFKFGDLLCVSQTQARRWRFGTGFVQIWSFFVCFAERSEAVRIWPGCVQISFFFLRFADPSKAVRILSGLRSNFIPIFAFRRAKRGAADFARFSLEFGESLCVSQSRARG
jgi:hypothetical protein